MAVSWYAKGAASARLIHVRRLGSSEAAPKRHMQPDFQAASTCWKVLTAEDLHSYIPSLHLLQRVQQSNSTSGQSSNSGSSSTGSRSPRRMTMVAATVSVCVRAAVMRGRHTYCLIQSQSKGLKARVLLKLRLLSVYDRRQSLQKDLLRAGVPVDLVAKLASHTAEEAKRYASNSCYELYDTNATPIKLDPLPVPLAPGSGLEGTAVDLELFRSPSVAAGPASGPRNITDQRLLPFAAAGIAPPAADFLVHPKLADVYNLLAKDAAAMSAQLAGSQAEGVQGAVAPQLVICHYAQVVFGGLDAAWQHVLEQQQLEEQEMPRATQ